MRLSDFQIKLFWFVFLVIATILSFHVDLRVDIGRTYNPIRWWVIPVRVFSIVGLFLSLLGIHYKIGDTVNIKYKITETDEKVYAKYLTLFLIIPYWTAVKKSYHSYTTQNMFGAEGTVVYSEEITFSKKKKALSEINHHKEEMQSNRDRFFERPKKEVKTVSYI